MKIYSLYSLYELDYPEKIKFIGITTQMLGKRISDIIACSKLETAKGFNSRLSLWNRELSLRQQRPLGKIHYENSELILVKLEFNTLLRQIDTNYLLNTTLPSMKFKVCTNPIPLCQSHCKNKNYLKKQFISENKDLTPAELHSKRMKACWENRKNKMVHL